MLGYFFRSLADNRVARAIVAGNPLGRKLSKRFVAGETLDQAISASRQLAGQRMKIALAFLGEHVEEEAAAREATDMYIAAARAVRSAGLPAYLSPKLTQLGLDIDEEFCRGQLRLILEVCAEEDVFLRVDMEGSPYTETTLKIIEDLHAHFPKLGTVLQAYLKRTKDDLERLLGQEIPVRIVKGAYNELAAIAYQSQDEVEASYRSLVERCLGSGVPCAVATHNDGLIAHARQFAMSREVPLENFEFQMLYGIRRSEQDKLAAEGFNVRVYLPFGPQWFPYFMRRLGERPANAIFLLKNLFR
ncbi:MAG: proline dehydrogenase family protein [Dehalococcoidia bacterium]